MHEEAIGLCGFGTASLHALQALHALLPQENLLFIVDTTDDFLTAEKKTLVRYGTAMLDLLKEEAVKMAVLADDPLSALVLNRAAENYTFPLLGQIRPVVREAAHLSKTKRIAVLTSEKIVKTHTYASYFQIEDIGFKAIELPADALLKDAPEAAAYLAEVQENIQAASADVLIFGMPELLPLIPAFKKALPECLLLDPMSSTAAECLKLLHEKALVTDAATEGKITCYVKDDAAAFKEALQAAAPELPCTVKAINE